jgi:group I intron endonuclease
MELDTNKYTLITDTSFYEAPIDFKKMKSNELCGIYCYENLKNGKKYVGQSVNLKKRIKDHERNYIKKRFEETLCGESYALWGAIKKYGRENFKVSILEICTTDVIDEREIYWISFLKSHVTQNGYNIQFGGGNTNRGITFSKEHRLKISVATKGNKNPFFGKTVSPENRKIISEANKGKVLSEEHKLKLLKSVLGKKKSKSHKNKISKALSGKKRKNSTSVYIGVVKKLNSWVSQIHLNKKQIHIGSSKTEIDAAIKYDKYILDNKIDKPINFSSKGESLE